MKKHAMHNVYVKAECLDNVSGFDVVLVFSGVPEFVLHHGHDGLLFTLLSRGIRYDELRRWKARPTQNGGLCLSRSSCTRLERSLSRLLTNIDHYLTARNTMASLNM